MTTLAYLDCPTGLSGDMCLGALVHAGVPLEYLKEHLSRLGVESEYRLWSESVLRQGQQATQLYVDLVDHSTHHSTPETHEHSGHAHHHSQELEGRSALHPPSQAHPDSGTHPHHSRHLSDIEHLIKGAQLPPRVEATSLAIFHRLAEAEGAVHGIPPEAVHFHEVGATDAIVDIVGTCLGLDWLNIDRLYCSALPTGGGIVRAAHGLLPVPAPAVLKLWEMRQVPIYHNGINRELVTPTGAAIATTLVHQFGSPPAMTLRQIGLGAGSKDLPLPNILRLWIGESCDSTEHSSTSPGTWFGKRDTDSGVTPFTEETIAILETQLDDLSPQAIGYTLEALFRAGAVDVFTQPVGMKKSRPGILLTVICPPAVMTACKTVLFRETTTLGIRHSLQQRSILNRTWRSVETPYGVIRLKVARYNPSQDGQEGGIANVHPEYEDCAQLARNHNLPWQAVHQSALQAWYSQEGVSWSVD